MSTADRERPEIVGFYENEDGDAWLPVEVEADETKAAQAYADLVGLLVVSVGCVTVDTQDCECPDAPQEVCPDDPDGGPCTVNKAVECWTFVTFDDDGLGRQDAAYLYPDKPVFAPSLAATRRLAERIRARLGWTDNAGAAEPAEDPTHD